MLRDLRSSLSVSIGLLTALALLATSCVPPPPPPPGASSCNESIEDEDCPECEVHDPSLIGTPSDRARRGSSRRVRSSSACSAPAAPAAATCTEVVIGLPGTITFHGSRR